jgi:broad specificity phosphatase PhoE
MAFRSRHTETQVHGPSTKSLLVYLCRHGEVYNPENLVYGKLEGFDLSETGRQQALKQAEAIRNHGSKVVLVASSPLLRARTTAEIIASALSVPRVGVYEEFDEWELAERWSGRTWRWVRERLPDEWSKYIKAPASIDFLNESLDKLAKRMEAGLGRAVRDALLCSGANSGTAETGLVVVSHADPLKALLLRLEGRDLAELHSIAVPVGSCFAGRISVSLDGSTQPVPLRREAFQRIL